MELSSESVIKDIHLIVQIPRKFDLISAGILTSWCGGQQQAMFRSGGVERKWEWVSLSRYLSLQGLILPPICCVCMASFKVPRAYSASHLCFSELSSAWLLSSNPSHLHLVSGIKVKSAHVRFAGKTANIPTSEDFRDIIFLGSFKETSALCRSNKVKRRFWFSTKAIILCWPSFLATPSGISINMTGSNASLLPSSVKLYSVFLLPWSENITVSVSGLLAIWCTNFAKLASMLIILTPVYSCPVLKCMNESIDFAFLSFLSSV